MKDIKNLNNTKGIDINKYCKWKKNIMKCIDSSINAFRNIMKINWSQAIENFLEDFEDDEVLLEVKWWYTLILHGEKSIFNCVKEYLWDKIILSDDEIISIVTNILKLDSKELQDEALSAYVIEHLGIINNWVIEDGLDVEKILESISTHLDIHTSLNFYAELSQDNKRKYIFRALNLV